MRSYASAHVVSTAYSGTQTFEANSARRYLSITMTSGTATVSFGGGDGQVPVTTTYEPLVCPTSEFTVTTTGDYVIVTG